VRTLATDLELPASTVHQMLMASGLQPHRVRTFTFSPDPDFEAKLLDKTNAASGVLYISKINVTSLLSMTWRIEWDSTTRYNVHSPLSRP
jgi:hypothetical protein